MIQIWLMVGGKERKMFAFHPCDVQNINRTLVAATVAYNIDFFASIWYSYCISSHTCVIH